MATNNNNNNTVRASSGLMMHSLHVLYWALLLCAASSVHSARSLTATAQAPSDGSNLLFQRLELNKASGGEHFSWKSPPSADLKDCSPWVREYISYHKAMRGKPGTKYLVNACLTKDTCTHGLGDRLRGLLPTFQLAKAHNRVLIIAWPSPDPLEKYFEPASINWQLTNDLGLDLNTAVKINPFRINLTHVDAEGAQDAPVWTIDTNRMVYRPEGDVKPGEMGWFSRVSWDSHCIYRNLFQPTAKLNAATDKVQQELLGHTDKDFVAVHLRMGNLAGEQKDITRGWDYFQGLLAGYKCAMERDALINGDSGFLKTGPAPSHRALQAGAPAASNATASTPRVLMLTDHEQLRRLVGGGMLRGVAGPSYVAHHLAYSKALRTANTDHEGVTMSIFVDLMLLTRARCLVWAKSGFPKFAMAWAWHPCTVQLEHCIQEMFLAPPTK